MVRVSLWCYWSGLLARLSPKRKRMRAERIICENPKDHHRKQYEGDDHVGDDDLVLVLAVHEYGYNEGRLYRRDKEGADDVPLAKINLGSQNGDYCEHQEGDKDLEEGALGNYMPELVVSMRM